ncbi:MAG: JAB domain-containing protein [Pseudomonadota bacterium]|jgi:DNA repair protein RadC
MEHSRNLSQMSILSPIIGRRAAREVLRHHGLADIPHLDRQSLLKMRHIGPRRAEALLALPRLLQQLAVLPVEDMSISCSRDVFDLYRLRLASLSSEQFMVLTLNSRNHILSEDLCALGSINTVHVVPSVVIRQAVIRSAPSIICLHNHPSGDPTPSPEDRLLTERIVQAACLMGVRMLDHVIVAANSYYSFSDAGAM